MRNKISIALATLSLATALPADTPEPGFAVTDLPGGGLTYTLGNGDYVSLGSVTVALYAEDGTLVRVLESFSPTSPVPPVSIVVDATETFTVFSRANGYVSGTYRVDLAGGPATWLSSELVYSPEFEDPDQLIFSTTGGLGDWTVERMDLVTGAVSVVSETYFSVVSSLELDSAGNLYLAHDADNDDESVIERFTPAQIAGPGIFAPGQGTVVHRGLEIPWSLELAPDDQTFYVGHGPSLGLHRISRFGPEAGQVLELLHLTNGEDVRTVQLLPGTSPAAYLPFQPPAGGRIVYAVLEASPYTHLRRALDPLRPTLAVGGPGTTGTGPFDVTLNGGPPNGTARVLLCPLGLYDPNEHVQLVGQVPVFYGLDRATLRPVAPLMTLDANGDGVLMLQNGKGPGTRALQALIYGPAGKLLGSTTAAFL